MKNVSPYKNVLHAFYVGLFIHSSLFFTTSRTLYSVPPTYRSEVLNYKSSSFPVLTQPIVKPKLTLPESKVFLLSQS